MEQDQKIISEICTVCHQPVQSIWYFCPNCGNKIKSAPLSTSVNSQIGLYAFSIILPMICFIMVTKWRGLAYARSADGKAKNIGYVACALLIISTIVTVWLAIVLTENAIQSSINSINTDFSL